MIDTSTMTTAMTDTIGAWLGRNMLLRMKIGSVVTRIAQALDRLASASGQHGD